MERLKQLQKIVGEADPDGLLLVPGIDGNYNRQTAQVVSYLLEGSSGYKVIETSSVAELFEDVVLLITPNSMKCFCTSKARDEIVKLFAGCLESCQVFTPTFEEESDQDVLEGKGWFHCSCTFTHVAYTRGGCRIQDWQFRANGEDSQKCRCSV